MELDATMGNWSSIHWRTPEEWKEGPQNGSSKGWEAGTFIFVGWGCPTYFPTWLQKNEETKGGYLDGGLSSCIEASSQPPLKHAWTRSTWCRAQKSSCCFLDWRGGSFRLLHPVHRSSSYLGSQSHGLAAMADRQNLKNELLQAWLLTHKHHLEKSSVFLNEANFMLWTQIKI